MKLGKLLQDKGIDCKIVETTDLEAVCAQAIEESRVYLTSNMKMFKKKISMQIGLLANKASP